MSPVIPVGEIVLADAQRDIARDRIVASAVLQQRCHGKRVVLTKGVFDLPHAGHLQLLQQCRALCGRGDLVVVALINDKATRRRKGPLRPINPEGERAEFIASTGLADYVTILTDEEVAVLIREVRPAVFVKGADTAAITSRNGTIATLPAKGDVFAAAEAGTKIVIFSDSGEYSTSRTLERISKLKQTALNQRPGEAG